MERLHPSRHIMRTVFSFLDDRYGLLVQVCRVWREMVGDREKKTDRAIVGESESLMAWAHENRFLESIPNHHYYDKLSYVDYHVPWPMMRLGYERYGWEEGSKGVEHAIQFGQRDRLEWIEARHGPGWKPRPDQQRWLCLFYGVRNLEMLQWMREEKKFEWDERTCAAAAEVSLSTLQWVRERGCPWDASTIRRAAKCGRLDVIQWARQKGCPWGSAAYIEAAWEGQYETFRWLHENGCDRDSWAMTGAIRNKHFGLARWAIEHDCPLDEKPMLEAAAYSVTDEKDDEFLDWLLEHTGWKLSPSLYWEAFRSGNVHMLDRLWNEGLRFRKLDFNDLMISGAFETDAVASVDWAWRNVGLAEEDFEEYCRFAIDNGDSPNIEEWFRRIGMAEKVQADRTLKCIRKLFRKSEP